MPAPLLAADVPWLLYRAFFSLPKTITDEQGRPVNALLGTVNALLTAIEACRPRVVVACLGAEEAAYRVELYPRYHAHRDAMPTELAEQWKRAPGLLASLGWSVFSSEQLEADDVMFSFARTESERGGKALLLSGDRDMFQAVDDDIAILELRKDGEPLELGPVQVRERYGIDPELVPDFIALRGDPSDGLPGAPGIGEKTAAELLQRHGSLEAVLADAEQVRSRERPRVRSALCENADLLRTFKRIAELQRIDVQAPADRLSDFESGARTTRELGMRGLSERLQKLSVA